jgi:hypothetical protein
LWRNDLNPDGNYLRLHLEGVVSNRDGIGATIIADTGDLQIERRVRSGSSYLSSSERTASFGLGQVRNIRSLSVYWPSGLVEEFVDVASNQNLRLVEGSGRLVPNRASRDSTRSVG